jgi:predicted 3-demethylubiquinone-9 3-methyltransferase (glyoxalase superfamily)
MGETLRGLANSGMQTDKFGLTWQIAPSILGELLGDKDPVKSQRAM